MLSVKQSLKPLVFALDFSSWKKASLRQCFPGVRIKFINHVSQVPAGHDLIVWGFKSCLKGIADNVKVIRVEDGFLRSVGLGVDLIKPLSWVIDRRGLYYDATDLSDLEYLLSNGQFTAEKLHRAIAVRERIVAEGLTKYKVGVVSWQRPNKLQHVILVVGQVESDASLHYGAPEIRTNLALLKAVKQENPVAYIIYKPHPDVVAGLRAKGHQENEAYHLCDEVLTEVEMGRLLMSVDEVHVLTSLAGFEALLRHKRVVCYGQPFYAGWGLTIDKVPLLRRSRKLALDELVAGVLIDYPVYMSRFKNGLLTVEQALDELIEWRAKTPRIVTWWRLGFRMLLRIIVGVK